MFYGHACQVTLSMGLSWQAYWSRLPFPPTEGLPDPGFKPSSPVASALAGRFFNTELLGKPSKMFYNITQISLPILKLSKYLMAFSTSVYLA